MSGEAVKVIVRCRPMNEREKKLNCKVGRILVKFKPSCPSIPR